MKVVFDVEANALRNPTRVWCIVCKDIDTGEYHVFKEKDLEAFKDFAERVELFIGHNALGYDTIVLSHIVRIDITPKTLDTLILSKLIDYPRKSHSIESYGLEFNLPKGEHNDFSRWSEELEAYCRRDVDICECIYNKYSKYIRNSRHSLSIRTEHAFQQVVNSISNVGFSFNSIRANVLLDRVVDQLKELDKEILNVFPPKLTLIREVTPRYTKHGTLDRKDFRFCSSQDLSEYNGGPFCRCEWKPFNPASHKQVIDVLRQAGWSPTEKTGAHKDAIKAKVLSKERQRYGWKINETNLSTLPPLAPKPARTIARRILLEARRRTLVEWLGLVQSDGRIHGRYQGLGAWTHRMSHQAPNTANIPTGGKLYGEQMRSLWRAPRGRLLVGVDAEGIQLRIFAHYINDKEFTDAIVNGSKSNGTDPHSLNRGVLGTVCRSREVAKRYIYALLLGAGEGKLQEILGCDRDAARSAFNNLIGRFDGLATLKSSIIPSDARRGWFVGLDGRRVRIPGETAGERRHLCMSGYLQSGEAIVMKMACLKWHAKLSSLDASLVNFVHDEWQTECPNDYKIALMIGQMQADSIREVGEELGLRCPLVGSYWSDHSNDYSIGINWSQTH